MQARPCLCSTVLKTHNVFLLLFMWDLSLTGWQISGFGRKLVTGVRFEYAFAPLQTFLTQHQKFILKKTTHTLWSPTLSLASLMDQTSEGDTLHACVKMLLKGGQSLFMFWGTAFVHYLFPAVYVKHTHKWENCKWIFSAGTETHLKTLITPFGFMEILKICSQLYILESTSGHLIRVC